MCVVGSKFHSTNNSTTEEIFNILKKGREINSTSVEFSGGEPTVRKDLPLLILKAKKLGYTKIGISTNGMLISDNSFCNKLICAGLTYISFSLHSPNNKINEIITGTPNSFDRTISGIKNAVNYPNLEVIVVTAVQKSNYKHLYQLGKLLYSLGVRYWNVCDLVPEGLAKDKYFSFSVNRLDLFDSLKKIVPLLSKMGILLFNFTQCSVPKEFPINSVMTMSRKCEETNFVSFNKNGEFIKSSMNNGVLSKISICNKCKHTKRCAGFWSSYLKLYGEEDIIKLAKRNSCINGLK